MQLHLSHLMSSHEVGHSFGFLFPLAYSLIVIIYWDIENVYMILHIDNETLFSLLDLSSVFLLAFKIHTKDGERGP